jgi:ceramide glucosyltransferase
MRGAPASGWRHELLFTQVTVHSLNLATYLSAAAAIWWVCSVAALLASFVAGLAHPLRVRRGRNTGATPPVSAIVPVKTLHADFEDAQRSIFMQAYPELEIIICAAEADSPAIRAAKKIQDEYPQIASRFIQSDCVGAASPKLNTLWPAVCEAKNDIILTKDSNLRFGPDELADLVRDLEPDTGLVSTISIAIDPRSFPAWIETSIINCYHTRMLMLGDAAGMGFGLGKVMLFRRSDLLRAGGFERLAPALGEDMALAQAALSLGLRTVLAPRLSHQPLGARSFADFWQRQLRWMIVWRVQLPAAFFGDILGSALPTAAAGALAARLFGFDAPAVAAATLVGWFVLESALCLVKGWPFSAWSLPAFLAREVLTPALWVRACSTRKVAWAGATCYAGPNSQRVRRAPMGISPRTMRSSDQ